MLVDFKGASVTWKQPSLLTILAILALAGSLSAETANEIGPFDPEEWTLQIVEKEFDPETGELHLVFENTSDSLTVTAFGVLMVRGEPDAAEKIERYATDLVFEGGIPPRGTYRYTNQHARPGKIDRFAVIHAVMDHEILSDATSRGDETYIEYFFETRTFEAIEFGAAIERYRNARVEFIEKADLMAFLRREIARDQYDLPIVTSYRDKKRVSETERNRIHAIEAVADQARQIEEHLLNGRDREEIVPVFTRLMEERYELLLSNLRESDLEELRRTKVQP